MDYNVQYHIDINGSEAASQLTLIATQVQNLVPKMSTQFNKLSKALEKFHKSMEILHAANKIPTIDVNTTKALTKVRELKQELAGLKNFTITPKIPRTKITSGSISSGGRKNTSSGDSGSFGYYRSRLGTTGLLTSLGVPYAGMVGTVAIGQGLSSIVKSAVEYEHTMDLAHSILKSHDSDLSTFQSRFEGMSRHMRQIGVETQFTATQIADATKFLAMAGLNVEQIDAAMKPVTNLAIIGDADLGQMADLVTNIVTGYGIKNNDIAASSDIMAAVSTGANTTVTEMAEAFKYAAGQLSVAGISFNEASAAIGILGNAGMKATVAGTGLRAMMMRMVNPTTKAKKVLDALGVTFTKTGQDGKKTIKSLQESFEDLHKAGAGLEELNTIFDKTASKAAIALMVNVENFKKLIGESINSFGIADALATKRQDTVKGLWYQISSQFTEDGMQVFEAITPLIKGYMHEVLNYLKTPEAVEMIQNTVYMFKNLLGILIKIGGWVVENWDWIKHLVITGFVGKKIFQLSTGVLDLARNIKTLGSSLGSVSSILGSTGMTGGAVGAGRGLIGKMGIWGLIISTLIGGFVALNSHMDSLATKADVMYNKLSKMGNWKPFLSESGIPSEMIQNENQQTVYDKYKDLIKSGGSEGSDYNALSQYYQKQRNRKLIQRHQRFYSDEAANAAAVAHMLANNESFTLSRNFFDEAMHLSPEDSNSVVKEITKMMDKNRLNVRYQFRDLYGGTILRHGQQGSTTSKLFPSLLNADPRELDSSKIPQTLEYNQALESNLMGIASSLQQFNAIRMTTDKSSQLHQLFDWIYRTSKIIIRPQDIGLQPVMGKDGKFLLQDIPDFNKDNPNIRELFSKIGKYYIPNYTQSTFDEITKILGLSNEVNSNNLGSGNGNIDVSGLDTDSSSGSGGRNGTGSTLRHITVNIDKLMSVDSMSVNTDEDIDAFKEKLKKALIDVVKDVEISY